MAHYVIGDIQGCHQALVQLLEQIGFSPSRDKVWFAGDLVNRGPDSLASVRFIYQLGSAADSVLGNHDFHLLAACNGLAKAKPLDKIDRFLNASDGQQLLQWLRHRPMLLESPAHRTVVTHAGIPPCWDLQQTRALAREVETALQSDNYLSLLARLYGNKPDQWNPELQGNARLRCIINYLTRMRLCTRAGKLEFAHKEGLNVPLPGGFAAWFDWPHKEWEGNTLCFGHWSTVEQERIPPGLYALDTGCVWGGQLTALELGSNTLFHLPCAWGGAPRAPAQT